MEILDSCFARQNKLAPFVIVYRKNSDTIFFVI